jgi:hypothetical protein
MTPERHLARFERLAQRLIDGAFRPFFRGHAVLQIVAAAMARALEDQGPRDEAPVEYEVILHPVDHAQVLDADADVVSRLAEYAERLARHAGIEGVRRPVLLLLADARLPRGSVTVTPRYSREATASTAVQTPAEGRLHKELRALDAFLVVDGQRHVGLNRPVLTLGRRTDNDIVLPASGVSRRHAQLRWRFGRFVIYDLGSRAGTLVNGEPVSECALQAGDVIRLSTVTLVYGEGEGGTHPRSHRDGATAVLPPLDEQE